MHGKPFLALDRDRAAQTIERQPFGEIVHSIALAIDQYIVPVRPDEEVEQRLALRGPQRRPDGQLAPRVVGYEALQETPHIIPRKPNERATAEGCVCDA